ncbi:hypothetical protein HJC23_002391 [Cyclotella cryptica]|uniref:Ankyrin repeat protein n=1 Tax=Cyclotella cryptica TaxID=29204 RepID=A0ABD3QKX5_9STRA|eukprot:CCRYP_004499-RA/>CCRYP_004499-RA protein AED:0.04 eAED:0.04 QI:97/1/1/1/1/1/7/82/886
MASRSLSLQFLSGTKRTEASQPQELDTFLSDAQHQHPTNESVLIGNLLVQNHTSMSDSNSGKKHPPKPQNENDGGVHDSFENSNAPSNGHDDRAHGHASQSKRRKICDFAEPQDEDDLKPAAKPSSENGNVEAAPNPACEPTKTAEPRPLAPTLEDYLQNGGHLKYAPRPEWCRRSSAAAICRPDYREGSRSGLWNHPPAIDTTAADYYARPSSPRPRPSYSRMDFREEQWGDDGGTSVPHARAEVLLPGPVRWQQEMARIEDQAQLLEFRMSHLNRGRRTLQRMIWENRMAVNPLDQLRPVHPWDDEENGVDEGRVGGMPGENAVVQAPRGGELEEIIAVAAMEGGQGRIEQRAAADEVNEDTLESHDSSELDGHERRGSEDSQTSYHEVASANRVALYGSDFDSALHLAIKHGPPEAALSLIENGANVDFSNAKGVTPLMTASTEGNLEVVRELLKRGASPNAVAIRGSTALIQACHFGKLQVVEELLKSGASVEQANYKNTTALMRASQEGHEDVVKLLLQHNSFVNRRNDERMSALMLSSQRGHARVVKILIKAGAEIDAVTQQNSSSLMLAIKRNHLDVARILVASGTELMLKDNKNRTVLETSQKRGLSDFAEILTSSAQVRLMQEESRKMRNFCMVCIWTLLQSERAKVKILNTEMTVHQVAENLDNPIFQQLCPSKRALVRSMTMPAPVMELIVSYVPLPLLYETRLTLLASRAQVDPDSAVFNTMDFIDEVLEEGGLLEAFDAAGVAPPQTFSSWTAFQEWIGRCDVILERCKGENTEGIFALDASSVSRKVSGSADQRRSINYLQTLAYAPSTLSSILKSDPYDMPSILVDQLKNVHDIQSIIRRRVGVHFDTNVANELVTIARMAVNWCESRPSY